MSKADLKNAMEALNVKVPLRLNTPSPTFRAPLPLDARKSAAVGPERPEAPIPQPSLSSSNTEKSGSEIHPVPPSEGQNLTGSNPHPVNPSPSEKRTGGEIDPVDKVKHSTYQPVRENFTQVPNELLRNCAKFSDPLDFMVYLHLYTYSHGYKRPTASMSQCQLERFTGATRNTVRKSLERLVSEGWIKLIGEYEHARMSRKWRVYLPEEKSKKPSSGTGSNPNPVRNSPCEDLTLGGSKSHPVTGSNFDPYKESLPKEKSKNSLSIESAKIQEYLASVKPFGKRETESRAYRGLKQDYTDLEIELALQELITHGTPGAGTPCHSPLAYLARAMRDVLTASEERLKKQTKLAIRKERELVAEKLHRERSEREAQEWAKREARFLKAFPDEESQRAAIRKFGIQLPGLGPDSPVLRNLAISAWSDQLKPNSQSL